jgi:hypothetical protein
VRDYVVGLTPKILWLSGWIAVLGLLTASHVSAQQTYFNIPNAELSTPGEAFVQQQLGLGPSGDAGLTVDFGMTKFFEFGFNILSVPLYAAKHPEPGSREPSVLTNAQLMFSVTPVVHLQVGTRQGLVGGEEDGPRARYSGHGHALIRFGEDDAPYGNYVVGAYGGSRANLGPGSLGGGMVGFEVPIMGRHLRAVGDWILGTNQDSFAALGLESIFDADGRWDLALGARLPSPRSGNDYGMIVQISWLSRGSH